MDSSAARPTRTQGRRAGGDEGAVLLRELLGRIDLKPEGEDLWAEYGVQPTAVLKVVGTYGSGGAIWTSSTPEFVDVYLR